MPNRRNKVILKGHEQHFILLSFLTVMTALILLIGLVTGVMWIIDPMMLGGASLGDTIYVGAAGLGLLAATYYYTLRIDHRVSGPVFVLMRNMDRLGEGDLTTVMRLRQQDHLKEISDSFNRNVDLLRGRIENIKNTARAIQSSNGKADLNPLLGKLLEDLDKLKTEVG